MKTNRDILEYIEQWISHAVRRPMMYAETPESFEAILHHYDAIRVFALVDESVEPSMLGNVRPGFSSYLFDKAGGSMTFCQRFALDHGKRPGMSDLVNEWNRYVASEYYIK